MIGDLPRDLDGEARSLVEMIDDVARASVAPVAAAVDRDGSIPDELLGTLDRQGLLAGGVPALSGLEVDRRLGLLIVSRVARASASVASVVAGVHEAAAGFSTPERLHGRDATDWRPAVAFGVAGTRAPDGGLSLVGTAPRVEADDATTHVVVVAPLGDGEAGVVELPVGHPGLTIGPRQRTTGLRGRSVVEVMVDVPAVPDHMVVGGTVDAHRAAAVRSLMTASLALGIGVAARDAAASYAAERQQFGRAIGTFPAVHGLIEAIDGRLASLAALLWSAAGIDDGHRDACRAAVMAARAAVDVCREVPRNAVQVLGGYGYIEEYPVAVRLRDAVSVVARAGGSEALLDVPERGETGA